MKLKNLQIAVHMVSRIVCVLRGLWNIDAAVTLPSRPMTVASRSTMVGRTGTTRSTAGPGRHPVRRVRASPLWRFVDQHHVGTASATRSSSPARRLASTGNTAGSGSVRRSPQRAAVCCR